HRSFSSAHSPSRNVASPFLIVAPPFFRRARSYCPRRRESCPRRRQDRSTRGRLRRCVDLFDRRDIFSGQRGEEFLRRDTNFRSDAEIFVRREYFCVARVAVFVAAFLP